jgi:MSHA biogenesis protein MshN
LPDMHLQQGLVIPQPQNKNISNISLVPTSAGLDLIIATVAGLQIATSQYLESHNARLVIGFEFLAGTAAQGSAISADKTDSALIALPPAIVAEPQSAPALTPAVTATLVRTQPAPQTDEQLYRRGLQQVRQGDLRAAQESFTGSLRINPELLAARLELIGVLQRLTHEQEAVRVIQEGLQRQPAQPELRKLLAHHLLSAQHYQDALTQLETAPVPAVAADPDYHALRAALYQELGEYPQAGLLYAQLLEQRPREPLWWMGLAIALDQQGLSGGARDAYRTALDVSGLRPDLEQFVRKRLQHL